MRNPINYQVLAATWQDDGEGIHRLRMFHEWEASYRMRDVALALEGRYLLDCHAGQLLRMLREDMFGGFAKELLAISRNINMVSCQMPGDNIHMHQFNVLQEQVRRLEKMVDVMIGVDEEDSLVAQHIRRRYDTFIKGLGKAGGDAAEVSTTARQYESLARESNSEVASGFDTKGVDAPSSQAGGTVSE